MDNHRIDKSRQEDGVTTVGRHLASLCNSTSNNGCRRGSKGELEEEESVVALVIAETKVAVPEKSHAGLSASEGKGVTNSVKGKSTKTGIQEILEHTERRNNGVANQQLERCFVLILIQDVAGLFCFDPHLVRPCGRGASSERSHSHILYIFLPYASSAKHRKSSLHHKDQGALVEKKVETVTGKQSECENRCEKTP
jgi:hypothetical protein